jgi:hypothetical protein
MAGSSLSAFTARFKALPRNQQLGLLFGIPAVIALTSGYYGWKVLGELGSDPTIPPSLRRENMGVWAEITLVQGQIEEKQKIIDRKAQIEATLNDLQGDIVDAEEQLPRAAEKAQMREVIERLAREIPAELGIVKIKSVRINEAAPQSSDKRGGLSTVTYQTEVQGDLNGIIKYIDSIEKNTRFMAVNQLSLRGGNVGLESADGKSKIKFEPHTVKMDIVTYVYTTGSKARAQ